MSQSAQRRASAEFARYVRPSRAVGLVLLILMLVFQATLRDTADVSWRNGWWDSLHRVFPRDRGDPTAAPAVVVAIDEQTMAETQRWPWPRDALAGLVTALQRHGATVIAFDILLDENDPQSPLALSRRFERMGDAALAQGLEVREDTDIALARGIYAAQENGVASVLPVPGVPDFPGIDPEAECSFQKPIVRLEPPDSALELGTGAASADPPLPIYQEAGAALAAIDFDASQDFVIRSVQALQMICNAPFPFLAPEALRLSTGGFFTTARRDWLGWTVYLDDPANPETLSFPVERNGDFWLHYGPLGVPGGGPAARELARYISARDVLSADFDPARIAGKIVLVAVIDLGRIDERRSPLGPVIFGVEVHMQMIEQIMSRDFLRRPWVMPWAELILLALGGLLVIWLVPVTRPVPSVLGVTAGAVGLVAFSALAFRMGLLIDAMSPLIGFLTTSMGVLAVTLIEQDRRRLRTKVALERERADRAALQGELDAAARMQRALLPETAMQISGKVDLACHLDPARTVGGDFYDHQLLGDRHLFLLIADVSGKGADASQFMVLSRTLWKSTALRLGPPLSGIVSTANAEITQDNAATMFVTGLAAILDLETGALAYAAAGHDAPYLFGQGLHPVQLSPAAGPPIGLIEDVDFPVGEVALSSGQRLCFFTDGVTEAMNSAGDLYGLARLEAALATVTDSMDSAAALEHILSAVRTFTGDAEQSDDLTMMIMTWR